MTTATLPLPTRLAPGPSVSGVLALLGLLMLTACAERPTTSARPPGPEVAAPHPLSYPAPQPRPNAALRAARAKRAGLDDAAMRAELQRVVVINLAAVGLSALGLAAVVTGILLG